MTLGQDITVEPFGKGFAVVNRPLWVVEKQTGDSSIIARAGFISRHHTEAEANEARDAYVADLNE